MYVSTTSVASPKASTWPPRNNSALLHDDVTSPMMWVAKMTVDARDRIDRRRSRHLSLKSLSPTARASSNHRLLQPFRSEDRLPSTEGFSMLLTIQRSNFQVLGLLSMQSCNQTEAANMKCLPVRPFSLTRSTKVLLQSKRQPIWVWTVRLKIRVKSSSKRPQEARLPICRSINQSA